MEKPNLVVSTNVSPLINTDQHKTHQRQKKKKTPVLSPLSISSWWDLRPSMAQIQFWQLSRASETQIVEVAPFLTQFHRHAVQQLRSFTILAQKREKLPWEESLGVSSEYQSVDSSHKNTRLEHTLYGRHPVNPQLQRRRSEKTQLKNCKHFFF